MRFKNLLISLAIFTSISFIPVGISNNYSYSVNMNESLAIKSDETTIQDGDTNVSISTSIVLSFNKNIATEDVIEHNKSLVKMFDSSGRELPIKVEAEKENSFNVSVADGLIENQGYKIVVSRGLQAEGGSEVSDEEFGISFQTATSINSVIEVEDNVEEPTDSDLDALKEEVEFARRQSEENAKKMKEKQDNANKVEPAPEEEKVETEIPEKEDIDKSELDKTTTNKDQSNKKKEMASPKVFFGSVAILALIVIVVVLIVSKFKNSKNKLEEDTSEDIDESENNENKVEEESGKMPESEEVHDEFSEELKDSIDEKKNEEKENIEKTGKFIIPSKKLNNKEK